MTLCPIALAVGCKKCPIFAICPVKSVIGDYKPAEKENEKSQPRETKDSGKTGERNASSRRAKRSARKARNAQRKR